jgi:hypothetical protein
VLISCTSSGPGVSIRTSDPRQGCGYHCLLQQFAYVSPGSSKVSVTGQAVVTLGAQGHGSAGILRQNDVRQRQPGPPAH